MESFSPNFENPKEFFNHLRLMGEMVIEDVSRLTPFMELLREERIYHPTFIVRSDDQHGGGGSG